MSKYVPVSAGVVDESTSRTATATTVRNPEEIPPLEYNRSESRVIERIFNCFLLIPGLAFLVFAGLCISISNKPVSENPWGEELIKASRLGPTIFPIFFGAVLAYTTAGFARWSLQQGEKLDVLERLHSSDSLAGALAINLRLRRITLLGICLAATWLLSPVGGQASLRILQISQAGTSSTRPVWYMLGNVSSDFDSASGREQNRLTVNSLFVSSLLQPPDVSKSSTDSVGNVKIPFLHMLPGYRKVQVANSSEFFEWVDVPGDTPDLIPYSSLVGRPVVNLDAREDSDFIMEYQYMYLNCPHMERLSDDEETPLEQSNTTEGQVGITVSDNMTYSLITVESTAHPLSLNLSGMLPWESLDDATYNSDRGFAHLGDISFSFRPFKTQFDCSLNLAFVEAKVGCRVGQPCAPLAVRHSTVPHTNVSNENYLYLYRDHWMGLFLYEFLLSITPVKGSSNGVTLLEGYLVDDSNTILAVNTLQGLAEWGPNSNITRQSFEQRTSRLLNTYWRSSQGTKYLTGKLPSVREVTSPSFQNFDSPFIPGNTTAHITSYEQRYMCSVLWAAILILCSLILVAAALARIAIGYVSLAPDVLGLVSTLTINNPRCPAPGVDSAVRGDERSRLLGNRRIHLEDVGDGSHGYISWSK